MKLFPQYAAKTARSKAGVCFALPLEGPELPVVDITHEAFKFNPGPKKLETLMRRAIRAMDRQAGMPRFLAKWLFAKILRSSTIVPKIAAARGRYLDGMTTYLFKLGAANLGPRATRVDKRVVESLPGISVRLRLKHCAELIACEIERLDALRPGRPIHLVNIAGGACSDSLNALLLLARCNPTVLSGRRIVIHSFDREEGGAVFASRSLDALRQEGAPFAAFAVEFEHVAYDWADPSVLASALGSLDLAGCLTVASSEGGLFEYGSDEEIVANLRALVVCGVNSVVGTISRTDSSALRFNGATGAALKLRDMDAFGELVGRAELRVARVLDCPLSHCFLLERVE